jgi:hypothetical protein
MEKKEGTIKTMEKPNKLVDIIKALVDKKFTGYIKIKFTKGSVGKVEKFEEILKK